MVYMPSTHLSARRGVASRLSAIAAWGVDMFGVLGAATRVASAVESRREPAEADLRRLGIVGKLPKV